MSGQLVCVLVSCQLPIARHTSLMCQLMRRGGKMFSTAFSIDISAANWVFSSLSHYLTYCVCMGLKSAHAGLLLSSSGRPVPPSAYLTLSVSAYFILFDLPSFCVFAIAEGGQLLPTLLPSSLFGIDILKWIALGGTELSFDSLFRHLPLSSLCTLFLIHSESFYTLLYTERALIFLPVPIDCPLERTLIPNGDPASLEHTQEAKSLSSICTLSHTYT